MWPEKDNRYLNLDDVQLRLGHSIVLLRGEPHMAYVQRGTNLYLYPLPYTDAESWERSRITWDANDDEHLDIKSLALGYVNEGTESIYVSRPPYKKQKQAIAAENLLCYSSLRSDTGRPVSQDMLMSRGFYQMLKDMYPGVPEALAFCRNRMGGVSRAFDKDFAFVKPGVQKIKMHMLGYEIGEVRMTGDVRLLPEYQNSFVTMKLLELGLHAN